MGTTFTASLQNLDANTVYYVRAYAVNADGTSYSNEISLKTFYSTVTDINGNIYNTVIIGGKEWMAENLRVDRFNDGTTIPKVSNDATWSNAVAPAFCIFNNSSSLPLVYGKLYNWYCVSSNRNLAPQGWHVSTVSDWSDLIYALGNNVGNKLRLTGTTYWSYSYGTNESGFSAIGAGLRNYYGSYESQLSITQFWQKGSSSYSIYLDYSGTQLYNNLMSETSGLSIRCVKD